MIHTKKDLYFIIEELEGQLNNCREFHKDLKEHIEFLYQALEDAQKGLPVRLSGVLEEIEDLEEFVYDFGPQIKGGKNNDY